MTFNLISLNVIFEYFNDNDHLQGCFLSSALTPFVYRWLFIAKTHADDDFELSDEPGSSNGWKDSIQPK